MSDSPPAHPASGFSSRRDLLLIALAGAILFLPFLGARDLWTSGEARVAQVARQMRFGGEAREWIVPYLGEEERLKKPPLAYWLAALASFPFEDVDEFASRVPNALAGIGAMCLAYLFGLRLFDRHAGVLGALALGTTAVFWWQARTTGIEMPLLFCNMLALYAWWRYRESGAGGEACPGWLLLAYGALGFSFLEKGPVGPLLVLLIVVVYLAVSGRWRESRLRVGHHLAGVAVMLGVALPWAILLLRAMPEAWDVWFRESAGRFEGFDHIKDPEYFALKVLGDGQPWVIVALLAPFLLKGASPEERKNLYFPLAWAVVTLVFFSIPASKKSYYILPIYPALALLAGAVLSSAVAGGPDSRVRKALRGYFGLAGGLASALALAGLAALAAEVSGAYPVFEKITRHTQVSKVYGRHWPHLLAGALVTLGLGLSLLYAARRRRTLLATGLLAGGAVAFGAIHILLTPDLNAHKGDRALCEYLRPRLEPGDSVYTYAVSGLPIVMYYVSERDAPRHVVRLHAPHRIVEALDRRGDGRAYMMSEEGDLRRLRTAFVVRAATEGEDGESTEEVFPKLLARAGKDEGLLLWGRGRSPRPPAGWNAEWFVVQPRQRDEAGRWRAIRDPKEAEARVRAAFADQPADIAAVTDLFERMDHPPAPNGRFWLRSRPSALDHAASPDRPIQP